MRSDSTVHSADADYIKEFLPFRKLLKRILHDKNYSEFDYKADTKTIYWLCRMSEKYTGRELPPLEPELLKLIGRSVKRTAAPIGRRRSEM